MKIEVTERNRSALANHTQKQNTRSEVKRLQQWHQPFTVLRAQMTVKASKDPNYITFKDELVHLLQQQAAFLEELYVWISECEALDKAEVISFFLLSKKEYKYIYILL